MSLPFLSALLICLITACIVVAWWRRNERCNKLPNRWATVKAGNVVNSTSTGDPLFGLNLQPYHPIELKYARADSYVSKPHRIDIVEDLCSDGAALYSMAHTVHLTRWETIWYRRLWFISRPTGWFVSLFDRFRHLPPLTGSNLVEIEELCDSDIEE